MNLDRYRKKQSLYSLNHNGCFSPFRTIIVFFVMGRESGEQNNLLTCKALAEQYYCYGCARTSYRKLFSSLIEKCKSFWPKKLSHWGTRIRPRILSQYSSQNDSILRVKIVFFISSTQVSHWNEFLSTIVHVTFKGNDMHQVP